MPSSRRRIWKSEGPLGSSLTEYGTALAEREIQRISRELKRINITTRIGTITEQIALLKNTVKLMEAIGSHPDLLRHAKPTLCHTDLHMGNIFVSENGSSEITSIIDWQFTQISPMFIQARYPIFLKPPIDYPAGLVQPELPDNYDDLNTEDKEMAEYELKEAKAAKAYEVRCYLDNQDAYKAMKLPRVYRELFIRCAETSAEGSAPLRACLIEISNSWHDLGFTGECPYKFSEEELQNHERQFVEYEEWHHAREFAQEYLGTDADGWISPELDFARKQEQNRALLDFFTERKASQKSLEELRRIWPFAEGL